MSSKNSLRVAVGATLACAAGAANAYIPTSNTDGDVIVYWAGASASTQSVLDIAVNAICDKDPHILYVNAGAGTDPDRPGSDWAIGCRANGPGGKTGFADDTKILIIKRDRGGSAVGVSGVQTKSADNNAPNLVNGTIGFLNLSGNCTGTPTPGVNGAPDVNFAGTGSTPIRSCAGTYNVFAFAEIGTSDIEPNKFFGTPNTPGSFGPFRTDADRAFAKQNTLAAVLFNTPVTLTLYKALQSAQFPVGSVCHPSNAGYGTVIAVGGNVRTDITNGDSEACMPSLTRYEIASLFATTGGVVGIGNWNRLLDSTGAPVIPLNTVQVVRRSNGSGTQAVFNALISGWPCDADGRDGAIDIVLPKAPPTAGITAAADSAAVSSTLSTLDASGNPYAIGILSLEGLNVDYSLNWRFIKIDGVAPTLRRVHNGDYFLWAQQSCQLRNTGLPYNASGGTIADKTKIYDLICLPTATNGLNNPDVIKRLDEPSDSAACIGGTLGKCGNLYRFGQSGLLASPTSANVYENVFSMSKPINAFTREVTAGRTNICQPALKSNAGGNSTNGVVVAPNPNWLP